MATLRDGLLKIADSLRALPNTFGLRRYSVTLRTRKWSGGKPGSGTATVTDVVLTPPPKVRVLKTEEVASSGGTYRDGDLMVEKITPKYDAGGYTPAQLNLRPATDEDVAVILTGDEGTLEAQVIKVYFDKPFNARMVVRITRGNVRG